MIDLTPLDVRSKKGDFRRGLRGYETPQVDDFLDLVADRLDVLVRENLTLGEKVARLEQQVSEYKAREKALTDTLLSAQTMRDQIRTQATRESEELRRDAEREAEQIRADAVARLSREEEALRSLHARRLAFLSGYRAHLEKAIAELRDEEARAESEATRDRGTAEALTRPTQASTAPEARLPAGPAALSPTAAPSVSSPVPAAPPVPADAAGDDLDARLGEMLSEWKPVEEDEAADLLLSAEDVVVSEPADTAAEADEVVDELAELEALIASANEEFSAAPANAHATGSGASGAETEADELDALIAGIEHEDEEPFVLSHDDVIEAPEGLEGELWLEEDAVDPDDSIVEDIEPFNPFAALSDGPGAAAADVDDLGDEDVESVAGERGLDADEEDADASPFEAEFEAWSEGSAFEAWSQNGAPGHEHEERGPEPESMLHAEHREPTPERSSDDDVAATRAEESVARHEDADDTHPDEFKEPGTRGADEAEDVAIDASQDGESAASAFDDEAGDSLFDGFDDDDDAVAWSENAVTDRPEPAHAAADEDIGAAFGDHNPRFDDLIDLGDVRASNNGASHDDERDGAFDTNFGLTLRPFFGEGDSEPMDDPDAHASGSEESRDFYSVRREEG